MDAAAQRELARLLAALRRRRPAYRVAGLVAEELGRPVLGWKVAAMKEEM